MTGAVEGQPRSHTAYIESRDSRQRLLESPSPLPIALQRPALGPLFLPFGDARLIIPSYDWSASADAVEVVLVFKAQKLPFISRNRFPQRSDTSTT